MTPSEVQRRPGGRGARVRAAVHAATLDVLATGGFSALSVPEVARRAGVHETSIYRRWGTRERLAFDALSELSADQLPVPDTGSIEGDLVDFGLHLVEYGESPLGGAVFRMLAGADEDEVSAGVRAGFWQTRLDQLRVVVDRAIRRNELPAKTDPRLLLELFIAPIHFRLLMTRETVDRAKIEMLARAAIGSSTHTG